MQLRRRDLSASNRPDPRLRPGRERAHSRRHALRLPPRSIAPQVVPSQCAHRRDVRRPLSRCDRPNSLSNGRPRHLPARPPGDARPSSSRRSTSSPTSSRPQAKREPRSSRPIGRKRRTACWPPASSASPRKASTSPAARWTSRWTQTWRRPQKWLAKCPAAASDGTRTNHFIHLDSGPVRNWTIDRRSMRTRGKGRPRPRHLPTRPHRRKRPSHQTPPQRQRTPPTPTRGRQASGPAPLNR